MLPMASLNVLYRVPSTSADAGLERLLTLDEVLFVLQVDVRTVDKLELPWIWVGERKRRLKQHDLDAFVERNRLKTRPLGEVQ